MISENPDYVFTLSNIEMETLRRSAVERGIRFDPDRRTYSARELSEYGLVREAYNSQELRDRGIYNNKVVTSFDEIAQNASSKLTVDAPFASNTKKWQLPIDMCEMRIHHTVFSPNSFVEPHVHPENSSDDPGGSLRIVTKGTISYAGRTFRPGDWFFIPNGIPYSFSTDPNVDTHVMYGYRFFGVAEGNRFSHPIEIERYRMSTEAVA